jgi:hypothetical protein
VFQFGISPDRVSRRLTGKTITCVAAEDCEACRTEEKGDSILSKAYALPVLDFAIEFEKSHIVYLESRAKGCIIRSSSQCISC